MDANTSSHPAGANEIEEVEITGSHIRGEAQVGSPLIMLDRDYIAQSGAQTTEELLNTLPQNFQGGYSSSNNATNTVPPPGAAFDASYGASANLRGLGPGSTLVLINGARTPLSGLGADHSDLSMIPLSAIDHVVILVDGASAIYGADAAAGVINFIMKSDYDGAETGVTAATPTRNGGGQQYTASQLVGGSWPSGNALLSYQYGRACP